LIIKLISLAFLVLSFTSTPLYAAQLSTVATADNELDARAEALRQLAESIQVKVSSQTLVSSQFKDNVATQELVDSVKTSTDLTLLGAEVFVMKTKSGYRAEAQLDTEQSFNLYLTKIKAEQTLINSELKAFEQLTSDVDKFVRATKLISQLNFHIKDYLVATMLVVKPEIKHETEQPKWLADLANKNTWLINLTQYLTKIKASTVTDIRLAALLLTEGIEQKKVYTCPIFKENGSWLKESNLLYYEINNSLPTISNDKNKAKYFLIGHLTTNEKGKTIVSYQLQDQSSNILQQTHVNMPLKKASWQTQPKQDNNVLLSIDYQLKDKSGKVLPTDITTQQQLYTLAQQSVLRNKSITKPEQCRSMSKLSLAALTNAYGTSDQISLKISAEISTFVLRPDPKEHEFALAKVTYQQVDLMNPNEINNKAAVGKKFPVLEPNNALLAAVEMAFKKLN